jgi:hypothetical protein
MTDVAAHYKETPELPVQVAEVIQLFPEDQLVICAETPQELPVQVSEASLSIWGLSRLPWIAVARDGIAETNSRARLQYIILRETLEKRAANGAADQGLLQARSRAIDTRNKVLFRSVQSGRK